MADERAHGNGKTSLETSGPICVQIGKWPSGQKSFRRRTENEVHHIEHLQFHTLDSNTCTQSNTSTHKYTYTPHRHQPYHTLCRLWCVFTYDFGHRTTVVWRTTSIDRNESHCLGVHRASHTHRHAHTHTRAYACTATSNHGWFNRLEICQLAQLPASGKREKISPFRKTMLCRNRSNEFQMTNK